MENKETNNEDDEDYRYHGDWYDREAARIAEALRQAEEKEREEAEAAKHRRYYLQPRRSTSGLFKAASTEEGRKAEEASRRNRKERHERQRASHGMERTR